MTKSNIYLCAVMAGIVICLIIMAWPDRWERVRIPLGVKINATLVLFVLGFGGPTFEPFFRDPPAAVVKDCR